MIEEQMADWTDQIAIVTGGSRGIGRAIARALAARGAAICINYATRAVEAEAAAGEIAATGGRVIAVQADVADADAVARMVARTEAELGPVSILVNNAGVSSPATLDSYDPAAMARMRRCQCLLETGDDCALVGLGREIIRVDRRGVERVGGLQLDLAAAFRAKLVGDHREPGKPMQPILRPLCAERRDRAFDVGRGEFGAGAGEQRR